MSELHKKSDYVIILLDRMVEKGGIKTKGHEKITMEKIAKELGCSKSTVSRAISGKGRISPKTRNKILKHCEVSGYLGGLLLNEMQADRTYNLAVILPSNQELAEVPFFHNCLIGISEKAKKLGYDVLLLFLEEGEIRPLINVLEQGKVDGVILMRTSVNDVAVEYLISQHIPFVAIGSSEKYPMQYVDNDTVQACKALTAWLIEAELYRIALIGGDTNHTVTQKRLRGFREGHFLYHRDVVENLIRLNCNTKEKIYETIEEIVDRQVDCIVCMDAKICCQVLEKLQDMHVAVPKDIKIASFYDSYILKHHVPSITSIQFNERELGMLACEKLIGRMEKKEYESKVFTGYEIIPRASTR